jgi:hypothetical protein
MGDVPGEEREVFNGTTYKKKDKCGKRVIQSVRKKEERSRDIKNPEYSLYNFTTYLIVNGGIGSIGII